MSHCVNINSNEFKALLESTGLNSYILASKISVWQTKNSLDKFPSASELLNKQSDVDILFGTTQNPSLDFSQDTLDKIGNFLNKIGVEQRLVPQFMEGAPQGVIAAANFIDNTVDILDDEILRPDAWNKLPEEAAHWWYRLLKHSDPLKAKLLETVKETSKYKELLDSGYGNYGSDSALTEEAIGQLIAESIARFENKAATKEDKSFWKYFIDFIKSILNLTSPIEDRTLFDEAAERILSGDIKNLYDLNFYSKVVDKIANDEISKIVNDVYNADIVRNENSINYVDRYNGVYSLNLNINSNSSVISVTPNHKISNYYGYLSTYIPNILDFDSSSFAPILLYNVSNIDEFKIYLKSAVDYFDMTKYEEVKKKTQANITKVYNDISDLNAYRSILNRIIISGELDQTFKDLKDKKINKITFAAMVEGAVNNYLTLNKVKLAPMSMSRLLTQKGSLPIFNKGYFQKVVVPKMFNDAVFKKTNIIKGMRYSLVKNFRDNSKELPFNNIITLFKLQLMLDSMPKLESNQSYIDIQKANTAIYNYLLQNIPELGIQDYVVSGNTVGVNIKDLSPSNLDLIINNKSNMSGVRAMLTIPERFKSIYGESFYSKVIINSLKNDKLYDDAIKPFKEVLDKLVYPSVNFYGLNIKNISLEEYREILAFNFIFSNSVLFDAFSDVLKDKGISVMQYIQEAIDNTDGSEFLKLEKRIVNKRLGLNLSDGEYHDIIDDYNKIDRQFVDGVIDTLLNSYENTVLNETVVHKAIEKIQYNPNEAYERGFGFYHGFPGYSGERIKFQDVKDFVDSVIWASEKELYFPLSTYTEHAASKDKKWAHTLGGNRQSIRIVLFPESNDIKLAGKTDIYSGQKDFVAVYPLSLRIPISKYQYKNDKDLVSSIADSIEQRDHNHNEQVINLKKGRFYFEYDETLPDNIKNYIEEVNKNLFTTLKVDPNIIDNTSSFIDNSPYVIKALSRNAIDQASINEANSKFSKRSDINIQTVIKELKDNISATDIINYRKSKQDLLGNYIDSYIRDFKRFTDIIKQYSEYQYPTMYETHVMDLVDFYLNSGNLEKTQENFKNYRANKVNFLYGIQHSTKVSNQLESLAGDLGIVSAQSKTEVITTSKYLSDLELPEEYAIIFGHPTIGKSFLSDKSNKFISLDDRYGNEIKEFVNANRGELTPQQYKGSKPAAYNKFMLDLFDKAKVQAKKENVPLLVSNTNILKSRSDEFDKIITISKEEFKKRLEDRGSFLAYDFEDWKSDIDNTIVNISKNKTVEQLRKDHYKNLLNKFASKFNLQWKENNDQAEIGRYQNGVVYINFNKIKADTVFHEFLHPFEQLVKKQNPRLWKSLQTRANKMTYDGVSIANFVKDKYPDLVLEDLDSEIIVTAMGLVAADPSKIKGGESLLDMMSTFAKAIVKYIKELFSGKNIDITDDRLMYLSFRELTDLLFNTEAKIDLSKEDSNKSWDQRPDEIFATLKALQNDITRNADHKYFYKGKQADGSVHSMVVDPYYEDLFGDKEFTEVQKIKNENLKELGNELHKMMEDIFYCYIDPATGMKRDTPLATKYTRSPYYDSLEKYFTSLIDLYKDENPRFMSEVKLFNESRNMGGTTDFVIIADSGVRIYDWKSIQTRGKDGNKIDDIAFFKEEAYRRQLGEYKNMLEKLTGARVTYAAAIPIEANVRMKVENGQLTRFSVSEFKIGDADPRLIDDDKNYLLPIVFKDQSTGDKLLDDYIKRVYAMIESISKESVVGDPGKRERKIKILNGLRSVVRSLQVRMNLANFKETAALYLREAKLKLNDPNTDKVGYKGELLDLYDMLEIFRDSSSYLRGILPDLDLADIDNPNNQDGRDVSAISDVAGRLMTDLKLKYQELAVANASKYGVENVLSPQKNLDTAKRNFRSISTMPVKTIEVLWQMLKRLQHTRDIKTRDLFKDLKETEDKFKKWASSIGQSPVSLIDKLLDHDENGKQTGQLLRKHSKDFWKKRAEAIKKDDIAWILNNTTFDEAKFNEDAQNRIAWINSQEWYLDPKRNEEAKKKKIEEFYRYNAPTLESNGQTIANKEAILNISNKYLVPNDKFVTKEWKELHAKGNEVLLEVYNTFQGILEEAQDAGMLEWGSHFRFIPNVQTNFLERLIVSGASEAFDFGSMLASITTNSDQGFMKLDPVNGKEVKSIPIYFKNDLVKKDDKGNVIDNSDKSVDLFKVFGIFGAHVYDYEMKSNLEDDANILLEIEKYKETYQTNALGHIKKDKDGNPIPIKGKGEASPVYKTLEDYVNFYIYGQVDNKDIVKKVGKYEISGRKTLNKMLSWMSLKTLSFNVPSATANLFGGKMNAFFEASKKIHFNEIDHTKSTYLLTSADKKAWAIVDYLNIFLEDQRHEMANKLSLFNSEKILDSHYLMTLQRGTDKIVQYPTALATTMNYMVLDGNIVSIKKHVRAQNNYDGSYDRLTLDEKRELDRKIEKEVEELKKTKSIYATIEVKDNKVSIPGIAEDSNALANFRAKIKKINKGILGNSTKDDITRARLTMLGQVYMQFRNWMPQMITERMGDYAYDPDLEQFTYGKTRMFFKEFFSKNVLKLTKDLIFGFGTNTIQAAKARYAQISDEMSKLGEEMRVSETEFIELYMSNLRSQMRELMVILAGALVIFAAFSAGDDDKDGIKKMVRRTTKRLLNELTFYYSPDNFTNLVKSPFPVVKLLQDVTHFSTNTIGQAFGFLIQSDEFMDKNKPLKYLANLFPITKELILWWATMDEDFRKEHDIKIVN